MTGDYWGYCPAKDLVPTNGLTNQIILVVAGVSAGAPLGKLPTQGYVFIRRVPKNGTPLTTGMTLRLDLVDDPTNSGPGAAVRLGVTVKRIVPGTSDATLAGAAAEVLATVTMPATSGVLPVATIAIPNASLPTGTVAGDPLLIQLRRVSTDPLDTHPGRVLMLGVHAEDS